MRVQSVDRNYRNLEAAVASQECVDFSFGENWRRYLKALTPESIAIAEASLRQSFDGVPLAGQRFLDIGCGSGLFSLCAMRLGAPEVVSTDVDPNAIACAEALRLRAGESAHWSVKQGSALDRRFIHGLQPAGLVYCWGVLHHTGALWPALDNVLQLVSPGGYCCLALYTRPRWPALEMACKRIYNRLPRPLRPAFLALYSLKPLAGAALMHGRSPVRSVREYSRQTRGMSFWRDLEDWLGGLPFEYTDAAALRPFVEARGFCLEKALDRGPGKNAEYLLRRRQ